MMLLKGLFNRKKSEDREIHGLAEAPPKGEQNAIRERMETEVALGKAQRAARAASGMSKVPPGREKL